MHSIMRVFYIIFLVALFPVVLLSDPIPHAPFTNPRTADSADINDFSLLAKMLDMSAAANTGAPHAAFTTVTASTDGTTNLAARATRRRVGWINVSSETIYIAVVSGSTGTVGLTVPVGGTGGMNYVGALYVHSASGTARVDFGETFD